MTPTANRRSLLVSGSPAPLFLPAIFVAAGIAIAAAVQQPARSPLLLWSALGLLLPAALAAIFVRRPTRSEIAVCAIALAGGWARYSQSQKLPANHVAHLVGRDATLARVEGVIVSAPAALDAVKRNPFLPHQPSHRIRFVLDLVSYTPQAEPVPVRGMLRVTVDSERIDAAAGDRVEVTGWLHELAGPQNPGEPDFRRWSHGQGIHAAMSADSAALVRKKPGGSDWRRLLDLFRTFVRSRLLPPYEHHADDASRLLDAMVLGQRSTASAAISEAFMRTGTIHFLSVSGFHVGLLGLVTWWLVRRVLCCGPRTAALVTLAVLLSYCLLAEPNSPILRATAMGVLACVAQLIGRPMSPVNWLAASALGILLFSPSDLFDPGFQLSFVQVAALLIVIPTIVRREPDPLAEPRDADTWPHFLRRRLLRTAGSFLLISFVCWLTALPLTRFHFQQFTPWAALQSMLITPLVTIVTLVGFATLLIQSLLPAAISLVGAPLRMFTDWLFAATDWLAAWPHTYIECRTPPPSLVFCTYVAMGLCWIAVLRCKRKVLLIEPWTHAARRAMPLLIPALAVFAIGEGSWQLGFSRPLREHFSLHVLAVGNGCAALAVSPDSHAALFDCGTLFNRDVGITTADAARELAVPRLDFVSVSHANLDHFSGLPTLLKTLPAAELVCSHSFLNPNNSNRGPTRLAAVARTLIPWSPMEKGDVRQLGPGNCVLLWPPRDAQLSWDENDRSLVFRLSVFGRRILIPGDISRDAMRALLEQHSQREIDLRSDVLIAPHHGAIVPETPDFYAAVEPEAVIVSTGQDRASLRRLVADRLSADCRVYCTAESGAVEVVISPDCEMRIRGFVTGE